MLENGEYPVINGGISPSGYINFFNRNKDVITVSQGGASAGFVNFINEKFWLGAHAYSVMPNTRLVTKYGYDYEYFNRFIYHILKMNQIKLQDSKQGAGIPSVSKESISRIEIPLSSKETQEKIVKILDKFTNYVTELQAALQSELQARNKQYEYYRDMLLSEEYLKKIYYKIFETENSYYEIKTMKLGETCEIKTGSKPKIVIKDEGQYKYINGGTIESGYVDSYNCDEDTVTTPSRGQGGIGYIGYQHDKFWLGALCYSIKSINKDRISNKFIYYYLNNSNHILKLKKEGGTPAINLSDLKNIRISFPILEVQNKVVEVLDKFQDLLSDTQGLLPEEIEQRQKQYEYYREKLLTFDGNMLERERERERAYLSNSYLKSLKEAGEIVGVSIFDIKKKNLGEVSDIVLGGTPNKTKKEYWENGTIPWMSSGEVNKKKVYSTDNFITQAGYDNSSATMVPANSTVIALAGQGKTRGLVARIKISLSTNQSLATLIPKDIIINDYMYYYLESQYNKLREVSSGDGSRGGLNKEILKRYPIIIPPIPIQDHVVSILDKFDKLVNDISQGLPIEIELRDKQYKYYRDKLLDFKRNDID